MFGLPLTAATVVVSFWSLWTRRTAIGCRWELAPTLIIVTACSAVYLTSINASHILNERLHRLTGLWNLENVLGHMLYFVCSSILAYTALVRLAGGAQLQRLYTQWIWRPLTIVIPTLVVCYIKGGGGATYQQSMRDLEPRPWLVVYWLVLCTSLVYLLGYAGRVMLLLRRGAESGCARVLNLYLAAISLTMTLLIVVCLHAITPLDLHVMIGALGCVSAMAWSIAPAVSWRQKLKVKL